jgi:hypothetical protein
MSFVTKNVFGHLFKVVVHVIKFGPELFVANTFH